MNGSRFATIGALFAAIVSSVALAQTRPAVRSRPARASAAQVESPSGAGATDAGAAEGLSDAADESDAGVADARAEVADGAERQDEPRSEDAGIRTSANHSETGGVSIPTPRSTGGTAVLPNGTSLVFGVGVPLLRFGVIRPSDQLARERDYRFDVNVISPGLLFHVIANPAGSFWRRGNLQVVSAGAFVLGQFNTSRSAQSEIAFGGSLYFMNATIGVGLAVDLYRGIPVLGPSGAGSDTAQTGLLGALLIRNGEFTVENLVFTLDLNLVAIGQAIGNNVTRPPQDGGTNAN